MESLVVTNICVVFSQRVSWMDLGSNCISSEKVSYLFLCLHQAYRDCHSI